MVPLSHNELIQPRTQRVPKAGFNSSPPSATYMQWTGSALVQIMACRLFGAKPLPEPMLAYCQLGSWEQFLVKIWIGILSFSCKKMHLKLLSANMAAILSGGDELNSHQEVTYSKTGIDLIDTDLFQFNDLPLGHWKRCEIDLTHWSPRSATELNRCWCNQCFAACLAPSHYLRLLWHCRLNYENQNANKIRIQYNTLLNKNVLGNYIY